jgi:bifunctional DNA-binding transcriptional regulator/antitoxin component of YhaV-PrlF toxin-antitoxin module
LLKGRTSTKEVTMPTVTVSARRELRLPDEVTRQLRIRKGAKLEVLVSGGVIHLIPPGRIRKDQRYFYTPEWQAKEREADADIAAGRVKSYSDVEALIRDLRVGR